MVAHITGLSPTYDCLLAGSYRRQSSIFIQSMNLLVLNIQVPDMHI